jgi:hypothetical protein
LPRDFLDALSAEPERARGVEFVGAFIPGVNIFDFAALAPDARMITTFGGAFHRKSRARERIHLLPKGYMSFVRYLAEQQFDLAILHLAPPGTEGRLSYGINQDFAPLAVPRARKLAAFVNHAVPDTDGEAGPRCFIRTCRDCEPRRFVDPRRRYDPDRHRQSAVCDRARAACA